MDENHGRDWKNERKLNSIVDKKDLNKTNEHYKMCFNNNIIFQQVFSSEMERSKGNTLTIDNFEKDAIELEEMKGKKLLAILPTVKIKIDLDDRISGTSYAILDTGSQVNIITDRLVRKFNLPIKKIQKSIIGIDGKMINVSKLIEVELKPWFRSKFSLKTKLWVLPHNSNWNLIAPAKTIHRITYDRSCHMAFADPEYYKPKNIEVILGVQFIAKVFTAAIPTIMENYTIVDSKFGSIVFGEQFKEDSYNDTNHSLITIEDFEMLDRAVKQLWELDKIKETPKISAEEIQAEEIYNDTTYRNHIGRFVVSIPLKPGITDIGSSKEIARHRFYRLESQLEKNPEMKEQYVKFMREYYNLGHMQLIDERTKDNEMMYYIPHHCIRKRENKFRVVFDGSCKTNKGISLNEVQLCGKKLQLDLSDIVMRSRRFKIAMHADMKMMYRQIQILREKWNLQRIFWREKRTDSF